MLSPLWIQQIYLHTTKAQNSQILFSRGILDLEYLLVLTRKWLLIRRAETHVCFRVQFHKGLLTYFKKSKTQRLTRRTVPYLIGQQTIQFNTIQYNTIQHNTIQYNTIQHNTIQYNTMKCNKIQYNTIQHNTIQYNTMKCNKIQYNTIYCLSLLGFQKQFTTDQ